MFIPQCIPEQGFLFYLSVISFTFVHKLVCELFQLFRRGVISFRFIMSGTFSRVARFV